MSIEAPPERPCNGGGKGWCGKRATVVCTERGPVPPLQWYACDNPDHQGNADTEPIDQWFKMIHGAGP